MKEDVIVSKSASCNDDFDVYSTAKKNNLKEGDIVYMQSNSLQNPRVLGKLSEYAVSPKEELVLEGLFLGKIPLFVKLPTGKRIFFVFFICFRKENVLCQL
jgi:hypothetical protein